MTRRWRSLMPVLGAAVGLGGLLVLAHRNIRPVALRTTAPGTSTIAGQLPDPRSCKPLPPVLLKFEPAPGGQPGAWLLELTALDHPDQVTVSMWTVSTARGAAPAREVWRGGLAAREVRRLDVQLGIPSGAAEVWAAAEVRSTAGAVQRSVAMLPAPGSPAAPLLAPAGRARRLVDPATGVPILEYGGQVVGKP